METAMANCEIPSLEHTIDGRRSMRSVADAIEALRYAQSLKRDSLIEIRTSFLPARTAARPSIVLVVCRASASKQTRGVALPTSYNFTCRRLGKPTTETLETPILDRAMVFQHGTVSLTDGTCLQAVNVVPAALPFQLTATQKRIVHWTIKFSEAETICYRCPPELDLEWLDYGALSQVKVPKLEAVVQYIVDSDPTLKVSRQSVANALAACGMRLPRGTWVRNQRNNHDIFAPQSN